MTTETIEVLTILEKCLNYLRDELPQQKFNTWLRPLHAEIDKNTLTLLAPNQFVLDWVNEHFLVKIIDTLRELCEGEAPVVKLRIGTRQQADERADVSVRHDAPVKNSAQSTVNSASNPSTQKAYTPHQSNLNPAFRFDNFVEGKSNQLARAAAMQVAENPGQAYNPL